MPIITRGDFGRFAPHATSVIADAVTIRADEVFPKWQINTSARLQMFMAMADVESAHFTKLFESMNYSAESLLKMWPSHFMPAQAQQYGRTAAHPADQRMIANLAYGSRMGNRGTNTDDGWLCRGSGLLGNTGFDSFARLAKVLGVTVDQCRAMLTDPDHMLECAVATFVEWGCLPSADKGDVRTCTMLINGGLNGLADRQAAFARAKLIWPTLGAPGVPMAATKPAVVTATVTYQKPQILRDPPLVMPPPSLWARFKSLFSGKAA